MTESFAELFEQSLKATKLQPGGVVSGEVVRIENEFVVVDAGLKSEGIIPAEQFKDGRGELTVVDDAYEFLELQNVGDTSLDVGGWSFGNITFIFPIGTVLAPGQVIVLGSSVAPANWTNRYPGVTAFGRFALPPSR